MGLTIPSFPIFIDPLLLRLAERPGRQGCFQHGAGEPSRELNPAKWIRRLTNKKSPGLWACPNANASSTSPAAPNARASAAKTGRLLAPRGHGWRGGRVRVAALAQAGKGFLLEARWVAPMRTPALHANETPLTRGLQPGRDKGMVTGRRLREYIDQPAKRILCTCMHCTPTAAHREPISSRPALIDPREQRCPRDGPRPTFSPTQSDISPAHLAVSLTHRHRRHVL